MRNNVIAFGLLFAILAIQITVWLDSGDGIYQALISKPGECRGPTSQYSSDWGLSLWDCDGNRLPNEQQDNVGVPRPDPQEAIVRNSRGVSGTPRPRRRLPHEPTPGWEH